MNKFLTGSNQVNQSSLTWLTSSWPLALGSIAASLMLVVGVISLASVGDAPQDTASRMQLEQDGSKMYLNEHTRG